MEKWLVIGSGGREYSIAQTLAKNENRMVYVAPGNVMMDRLERVETTPIDEMDFDGLINFAREHQVAYTVVGPEDPLVAGVVDQFEANGLRAFGPRQNAAELESSKVFAKRIMKKAGVATADYRKFTDGDAALHYVKSLKQFPVAVKANGLAGGKGVVIAHNADEATQAVTKLLINSKHQDELLIEQFLKGEEFSLFTMVYNGQIVPMPVAQDHKRLHDGGKGPNTGGMGAYSPVPEITPEIIKHTLDHVVKPVVDEMKNGGRPFNGFLYSGLMQTANGTKVVEFNVRMGDPETQVVLPQLKSDLGNVIKRMMFDQNVSPDWQSTEYHLGTIVASKGYPKHPIDEKPLPKVNQPGYLVTYAGVKNKGKQVVSDGGRILMVSTSDSSLAKAQHRINRLLDRTVDTNDYTYRHDIGYHGINYLRKKLN
ncbi:phosphoribosylamine--glycine ligase [Philodulcilactobacillus myokoensis]|uniref:Phosphoribosylamine--glycine ligase n=1 Tax=Philodulcilactobacillus myokoensis TaxID=2929573 RepID=A0A9W6B3F0_9LACO|nr:phosphoribosylamine--glycine ligase [Philodulcilactobacillus myokoensis]GLB47460.1 phosphoribosylamine--glycine ligase [Philodulcilactobacillus myokoensis]